MTNQPISPWATKAERTSPDGRYVAHISSADEVHMGAPTSGRLVIADLRTGGIVGQYESCNPSFVWSAQSDALAVPQWTSNLRQRLAVISVPDGRRRVLSGVFRVLELHSFHTGIIQGVDSSAHMPSRIELSAGETQREG